MRQPTKERELAMQIWRENTPGRRNSQATGERPQGARQVGETARKPVWLEPSEQEREDSWTRGQKSNRAQWFRPPGPFEAF